MLWFVLLQNALLGRLDAIHFHLDLLQNLRFPFSLLIHLFDPQLLDQFVPARRQNQTRFRLVDHMTEVMTREQSPLDDKKSEANSVPEQPGIFHRDVTAAFRVLILLSGANAGDAKQLMEENKNLESQRWCEAKFINSKFKRTKSYPSLLKFSSILALSQVELHRRRFLCQFKTKQLKEIFNKHRTIYNFF